MIDLHTHILPGVDDGSQSMEMSLELLHMAAQSGVDRIVATPHCNIPFEYDNYLSPELEELWEALKLAKQEAGIPIELLHGMEIFATPELPELLEEKRVWTLNGTSYFLTEFSFNENPDFVLDILEQCTDLGYRPVIAHPERYFFIQDDPQLAYELCVAGYPLQLNKGSLLGRFGPAPRHCAEQLMDHGLAACVASDAHRPYQRSTYMREIRDWLNAEFGEDYQKLLLEINPGRILRGEELLGYEPISFLR